MDTNIVIQGDCLENMREMESESIDCIITSPPYNIGAMHSNTSKHGTYDGNDMSEDEYQKWQVSIINECYRLIKPNGSIFYNHKVRIRNGVAIHPIEWICKSKVLLKQEIVWDMGKSANCDKIRFFPFSERIYRLVKDSKTSLNNKNKLSDVWRCVPTHKRKDLGHIAVMPVEIVLNILKATNYNIVLDCFAGSGTTGVACKEMGRQYILIEKEPKYIEIINKRLSTVTKSLFI